MTEPAFLNRKQAALYISSRVGVSFTAQSLADRAYAGTGPIYSMFGGTRGCKGHIAVYAIADLDAWIQSQLHAPLPRSNNASAASSI
jgi:hypothetical protein